jgi:hypothetical protein
MQAAGNSLITLLIFWGLPMYLLDRRARQNERLGWMRFAIAFFMLFWFLIVPVFFAINLAGPKRPRGSGPRPGPDRDPEPGYTLSTRPYQARRPATAQVPAYDRHSEEAIAERLRRHQLSQAKQRKEAQARALADGHVHDRHREPPRTSRTRPYLTPEQRAAERKAQALQDRHQRQQQPAREKHERQEQADRERQAQNDLFMTWDERGEEELLE